MRRTRRTLQAGEAAGLGFMYRARLLLAGSAASTNASGPTSNTYAGGAAGEETTTAGEQDGSGGVLRAAKGFVTKITAAGLVVTFFNNVHGLVNSRTLLEQGVDEDTLKKVDRDAKVRAEIEEKEREVQWQLELSLY